MRYSTQELSSNTHSGGLWDYDILVVHSDTYAQMLVFPTTTTKQIPWHLLQLTWLCFQLFTKMQHADLSFRCLALTWVIWPLEKSKTSSLSSLRMTMLFWQRLSLVRLAPTMSLMKVGQCLGHSCFRIYRHRRTHIAVTWFKNDIFHWDGHVIW